MKCSNCKKETNQIHSAFGKDVCAKCFAIALNEAIEADEQEAYKEAMEIMKEIGNRPMVIRKFEGFNA